MKAETYIRRAQARLDRLSENLEEFRKTRTPQDPTSMVEYEGALDGFKGAKEKVEAQLRELTAAGSERWMDIRSSTETAFDELGSLVQRVGESFDPVIDGTQVHRRYFLGPDPKGGWGLRKAKAARASKRFGSKAEALAYCRRYVRAKAPSQLVVRRRDGTFEATHTYR